MTEEKVEQGRAVARTVSFTEQEWVNLQKLATAWRTSRSGALRRIWMEWRHFTSLEADFRAAQEGEA